MTKHIPIFYEGQDDLIDILATSMVSICYNTSSFIDFYILDCGLSDFNKKQLESMKNKFQNFSIEFIPIDLSQFKGLRGWGNGKFLDCYARLLIPDLKLPFKKVIYLDSDTIALDDIQKLYDIDLEDYPYAAVPDLGCSQMIFDNCINNLGIDKNHIYPNAGMLVLNLEKIKSSEKLLETCRKYNKHLLAFNEEIFSITFGCNNYKQLDLRFNIADRRNQIGHINAPHITDDYINEEWKHVVLQHLTPTKPWKYLRTETHQPIKNIWAFWNFAAMTPFYEGMQNRYLWYTVEQIVFHNLSNQRAFQIHPKKTNIKLFGFLPILTIKQKGRKKTYKLFDFLPLFKVKEK